jgi:hypothetical protein
MEHRPLLPSRTAVGTWQFYLIQAFVARCAGNVQARLVAGPPLAAFGAWIGLGLVRLVLS